MLKWVGNELLAGAAYVKHYFVIIANALDDIAEHQLLQSTENTLARIVMYDNRWC